MSDAPPTPDAPATDAPPESDAPLGESGQKALEAMKAELKSARAEAKRAKTLEADLDKLREASQSDQEKALTTARKEAGEQARSELAAELFQERIDNAITTAAAGRFADPSDAVMALRSEIEVGADGRPDAKAVRTATEDLLKRKPYLAAEHLNTGNGDGGIQSPATDPLVTPGLGRLMHAYEQSAKQ